MRRIPIVLTVGLLTAIGGGAGLHAGAATRTVSVDPSTNLGVSTNVQVNVAGFPAGTEIGTAECVTGAVDIGSCNLDTAVFVDTDASGAAQVTLTAHAEISTGNGAVDCTFAGACDIAAAVVSDITGTAVTTPVSFAALPAAQAGTITAPTAPVAADILQTVGAGDFAPSVMVEFSVCTHGATSPAGCEPGADVYADGTGTASAYVNVPATLATPNGDTDCTVTDACDFAVWDVRDFSTAATSPLAVAPLVAGTVTVTPETGLHDGDVVQVGGSGWPANQYLSLDECNGSFPDHCAGAGATRTNGQGHVSAQFTVESRMGPTFDCDLNQCSIALTWSASQGVDAITAQHPITFATDAETAHYTDAELAAVQQAASTLGMPAARLQHDGAYALDFVLHLAHVSTITPAPDQGPNAVETDWLPADDTQMTAYASSVGATLPELEKTGALFVAYVLALDN